VANKNNGSMVALIVVVVIVLLTCFYVAGYVYEIVQHRAPPRAPTELAVE
jgi:hypothetical protein